MLPVSGQGFLNTERAIGLEVIRSRSNIMYTATAYVRALLMYTENKSSSRTEHHFFFIDSLSSFLFFCNSSATNLICKEALVSHLQVSFTNEQIRIPFSKCCRPGAWHGPRRAQPCREARHRSGRRWAQQVCSPASRQGQPGGCWGARGFLQPSSESPGDGHGTASQGRPAAAWCSTVLMVEKSPYM